jgi:hypothetical protein
MTTCRMQSHLADVRSLLPMKQMHTPPAPPTDAPPSAQERRGQQRQQRWRRRQHCQAAAPAAARQGAQPPAGAAGEAHASFPVRAADVVSGGAADIRSQRHAAEGLQPMNQGTGRITSSTVFPTDESNVMYGALTRVIQPPRSWQSEADASQRYGLPLAFLPISAGGRGGGDGLPRPRVPGVGPRLVPPTVH